jgi:hypothetical protein
MVTKFNKHREGYQLATLADVKWGVVLYIDDGKRMLPRVIDAFTHDRRSKQRTYIAPKQGMDDYAHRQMVDELNKEKAKDIKALVKRGWYWVKKEE